MRGEALLPGDKSVSHRALLLAAVADGSTAIHGLSSSIDVSRTLGCLLALGVPIARAADGALRVEGRGPRGLAGPPVTLDCGDSGTTMRLLAGLLAVGDGIVSMANFYPVLARRVGGRWERSDGGAVGDLGSDDLSNVHALIDLPSGYTLATTGTVLRRSGPPGRTGGSSSSSAGSCGRSARRR